MRIIIGSLNFPDVGRTLASLLPSDEVVPLPVEELPRAARVAEVLIPTMALVGREVIEPSSLRLIQQWGVGLEGVDIPAASARGIAVCNVPADMTPANAESTAEQAVFLMMAAARRFHLAQRALVDGPWGQPQGVALWGRNALVLGLGAVGKALAKRLVALGMEVSAVKARPEPGLARELGLKRLAGPDEMPELLPQADFLAAARPATPATLGLLNAEVFAALKPGAVVVNVGRGAVMDETALLAALDTGHLAGAGLDVFATEPLDPDSPLITHPKVMAMPHVGGVTEQSFGQIGQAVAANIENLRAGRPLNNQTN